MGIHLFFSGADSAFPSVLQQWLKEQDYRAVNFRPSRDLPAAASFELPQDQVADLYRSLVSGKQKLYFVHAFFPEDLFPDGNILAGPAVKAQQEIPRKLLPITATPAQRTDLARAR